MVRGGFFLFVIALTAPSLAVAETISFGDSAAQLAKACGADRVELYTEPFAQAFQQGKTSCEGSFDRYAQAARLAHELGLGVNAGHDLDRHNLIVFRNLPHLDEVSIGHAIWAEALFQGIDQVVSDYLALLAS